MVEMERFDSSDLSWKIPAKMKAKFQKTMVQLAMLYMAIKYGECRQEMKSECQ